MFVILDEGPAVAVLVGPFGVFPVQWQFETVLLIASEHMGMCRNPHAYGIMPLLSQPMSVVKPERPNCL